MQWLFYFLVIFVGRLYQLSILYFADMPGGGNYVENIGHFLPCAIFTELGYISCLVLILFALSKLFSKKEKIVKIIALILGAVYLGFSGGSDELMRWMGQHLTISYLQTYSNAVSEPGLVGRIFLGGLNHFLLSILGALFFITCSWFAVFKIGPKFKVPQKFGVSFGISLLVAAIVGLNFTNVTGCSRKDYKRIAPAFYFIGSEIVSVFSHMSEPAAYKAGIEFLGGDPNEKYPFFHKFANEKESFEKFVNKPFEERPDIIYLTIETFRGWTADFRREDVCRLMPNICELAKSGTYYARAYSVGYPSVEGFLGMQTGLWSHPNKSFLSERGNIRTRSLPGILKHAGYYRSLVTATNPSFDNLVPWFEKWYDFSEFDSKNQDDVSIANRFIELYRERPKDKPFFFNWMSTTMHVPFTLPEGYDQTGKNPAERYEQVLAYMDSAVGIILNEVKNGKRANSTIFVLAGDHSYPTQAQNLKYGNGIHPGFVWIPLVIAGPGIPENFVDERIASQTDIAPTLLNVLGLQVSNNFPGKNLLDSAKTEFENRTVAFRLGEVALFTDSLSYYTMVDGDELAAEYTFDVEEDLSSIGERFICGKSRNVKDETLLQQMQNAASAWEWVVDEDLLSPEIDE